MITCTHKIIHFGSADAAMGHFKVFALPILIAALLALISPTVASSCRDFTVGECALDGSINNIPEVTTSLCDYYCKGLLASSCVYYHFDSVNCRLYGDGFQVCKGGIHKQRRSKFGLF